MAAAILVVPLLTAQTLPPLAAGTRVFFAEPLGAPPPPPPPAAPRAAAPRVRPTTAPRPETPAFSAPAVTPETIVPEETADLGIPGGEPGGVLGGVPGGVVGGIVGGLPEAPAPPSPIRVGGGIREPAKVRHVDPVYPDIAVRANIEGTVILECLVSTQGRIVDARVLQGIPLLNAAALEAVRQWVYTPTLVDGVPVPVIMTVTVRFGLRFGR